MYGLGLMDRNTRYTSRGSEAHSTSTRSERTTWNTSPSRMASFPARTAASNSSCEDRKRSGGSGRSTRTEVVTPRASARTRSISSSRATASAHASSTRSSVASPLMAFAMSQTVPV